MNIHEYQAKALMRQYGVPTPRGIPCFSVGEALEAGRKLDPAKDYKMLAFPYDLKHRNLLKAKANAATGRRRRKAA